MAVTKVMPIQEIEKSELEQTDAPRIVPVYVSESDAELEREIQLVKTLTGDRSLFFH